MKNNKKAEIAARFVAAGASECDAEILADSLVTADAYGVSSHGTRLAEAHISKIEKGGYNLSPSFKVIRETAAFAVIDGDNAIGPVSATYCVNYGIEKARESGVFTVFSRNNNTLGPAFYYSLKAAERGCIAIVATNSPAQMAPVGGVEKLLGTNPFSAVIPVPGADPVIIDMATSVVAKSKFKEYKEKGEALPSGWALDKDGNPTTDPDTAMAGLVLPMAGFKGYAISMLIDIISGVMSGAKYLNGVGRFYSDTGESMGVGYCITVIDPTVVCPEYEREITEYVRRIRESKAKAGSTVTLPGDDRIKFKRENYEDSDI